jgi:RNA polymerase sigma-70 factor (ECF subfamily)
MALRSITYQNLSDEALMPEIAEGSSSAFDELYKRYGQKLFSYFFRMLWKNKELAEDCTQELFIKLIKAAQGFEQGRSLSTWLYSIAHNMCKNEYRREEVRTKHMAMNKSSHQITEAKNLDLHRFKEAVHDCMSELDEEKKSLFVLRFQEQLSVPEISGIMNIPEGTVKSRLFYLLKDMKEKLKHFETVPVYP